MNVKPPGPVHVYPTLGLEELAFNAMLVVVQDNSAFKGLLVRSGLAGGVVFCVTSADVEAVQPLEEFVAVTR